MNIKPKILAASAHFRIAALTHEDMLASSITLPMEIMTGAAQALGRNGAHSLEVSFFALRICAYVVLPSTYISFLHVLINAYLRYGRK